MSLGLLAKCRLVALCQTPPTLHTLNSPVCIFSTHTLQTSIPDFSCLTEKAVVGCIVFIKHVLLLQMRGLSFVGGIHSMYNEMSFVRSSQLVCLLLTRKLFGTSCLVMGGANLDIIFLRFKFVENGISDTSLLNSHTQRYPLPCPESTIPS